MTQSSSLSTDTRLSEAFGLSEHLYRNNLDGVTEALAQSRPAPDANNILWVAGHIAYWRNEMTGMLGGDPEWTDAGREIFKGMVPKAPEPTDGWDLRTIVETYDRCTVGFYSALGAAPSDLEALDHISKLLVHEGYHVGQLGLLRRLAGVPGGA